MSKTISGAHTRWNLRYHMVWIVKYRKDLLYWPGVSERFCELIKGISERYEWVMDSLATDGKHVHVFMGAPPRYAPAEVVKIMRSITAREIFRDFPQVKEELWGGEFWGDGYYVRTVGNEVTAEVIREYIKRQETDPIVCGCGWALKIIRPDINKIISAAHWPSESSG